MSSEKQEKKQDEKEMLNIMIKAIKVYKRKIKIKGREYSQYNVNLPKSFIDAHKRDKMFAIMNNILIMAPSEKIIFKLVERIPEIEELIKEEEKK